MCSNRNVVKRRGRERRLARRNAEPQVLESSSQDSAQDRQASAHSCMSPMRSQLWEHCSQISAQARHTGRSREERVNRMCALLRHISTQAIIKRKCWVSTCSPPRSRQCVIAELEAGPIASKALLDTVARLRFHRGHRDLPHSFTARQNIMIAPAAIRPINAGVSASLPMTIFSTCGASVATGMPPFVASLTCTNSGDVIGWPILLTSKH